MKQKGFTLIELMIAIVIVAILTTIAVSSYERYIESSYRSAVESKLLEMTLFLEKYYTTNGKYTGAVLTGFTSERYSIESALTKTTFTLTATPTRYSRCGVLTINEKNQKTPSDGSCW